MQSGLVKLLWSYCISSKLIRAILLSSLRFIFSWTGFSNMQWKGGPVNNGPFIPATFPQQSMNGLSSQANTSQGAGFQNTAPVPSPGPPTMNGPSRPPFGMAPQMNQPGFPPPTQGQLRPFGPPQGQPYLSPPGQQRMTQVPPVSSSVGQTHLGQGKTFSFVTYFISMKVNQSSS